MTSIYKLFSTEEKYEKDGVWLEFGDGLKIKIARAGGRNKQYLKELNKLQRKYGRLIENDVLENSKADELLAEIYAKTILLDWEGITDENDKPLLFNVSNAKKILLDIPDLFILIRNESSKLTNFREQESNIEEIEKN